MNSDLMQKIENNIRYLIELLELSTQLIVANKIKQISSIQQEMYAVFQFLQRNDSTIKQALSTNEISIKNKWVALIKQLNDAMHKNAQHASTKLYVASVMIEAIKSSASENKDTCKAYNAVGNAKIDKITPALSICSDV